RQDADGRIRFATPSYELRLARDKPSGLLPLLDWHRNSGNLQLDREQRAAAGKVQRLPVVTAKADVRRRRMAVHDATKLVALRVEDVDAGGAAAIDVAGTIDLHAVGPAGPAPAQIGKDAVTLF